MKETQNFINHVALVLDASDSMSHLARQVVEIADAQVQYLAKRSQEMDQETRLTVYTFNTQVKCLFYDKDVLRLPSLRGHYSTGGYTALMDATYTAIDDLKATAQRYGDHSFLGYVLTDGEENASRRIVAPILKRTIEDLPDNWTIAGFVPSPVGMHEAKKFGFSKDNLSLWDTSAKGMAEVGEVIRRTTDSYMTMRASGVRGTKNLFKPDTSHLNKSSVKAVGARKLTPGQFRLIDVKTDGRIDDLVSRITGRPYVLGEAFYQLTKKVTVQAQKSIALLEKKSFTVFVGHQTRSVLGLPDFEVKIEPVSHPSYDIFVQSTSVNRKLLAGTKVLLVPQSVQYEADQVRYRPDA